jgi:hypothetical protein
MNRRRPISITVLGVLLILAGSVGLVYHATEFKTVQPFPWDLLLISIVRMLAILAGAYMLLGRNWARWLALAWIAFHVVVGAFHGTVQFAMHSALLLVFAFLLFRPAAKTFFGNSAP